ncbi:unnamed protein product [Clonostachys rosea f. rosea IK726]|uniref:Uncharacterized protein n=1 Tax=Clonostachys rosea f. rosea IK726 TaxID=1349383 RepID=A0ACA9TKD6_BIOOC|nr:unnamed protein product [Clonostachys rosea f. rosea IK726]
MAAINNTLPFLPGWVIYLFLAARVQGSSGFTTIHFATGLTKPKAGMSLIEGLPTEILLRIVDNCTWETTSSGRAPKTIVPHRTSHSRLCRTSRLLHETLNRELYVRNLKHDKPGASCVLWAARVGRLETVIRARQYGVDLDTGLIAFSQNGQQEDLSNYEPPFLRASRHHQANIIEYLLRNGVDSHVDRDGKNALHLACIGVWKENQNTLRVVERLIAAGGSVQELNTNGRSPLGHVLKHQNWSTALMYVRAGGNLAHWRAAPPNNDVLRPSLTILHACLVQKKQRPSERTLSLQREFIAELLDRGVDVNSDRYIIPQGTEILIGAPPLFYAAAFSDNPACTSLLLERGATIPDRVMRCNRPEGADQWHATLYLEEPRGWYTLLSALFLSEWGDQYRRVSDISRVSEQVRILLRHGASLGYVPDHDANPRMSALEYACIAAGQGRETCLLDFLLENATDANIDRAHIDEILSRENRSKHMSVTKRHHRSPKPVACPRFDDVVAPKLREFRQRLFAE